MAAYALVLVVVVVVAGSLLTVVPVVVVVLESVVVEDVPLLLQALKPMANVAAQKLKNLNFIMIRFCFPP